MSQVTIHNNSTVHCIPRTDNFMKLFNARMKFLVGNDVAIGAKYSAWETVDGHVSAAPCQAIAYDGQYLYVHTLGTGRITELMGDLAEYHGVLMADKCWNGFDIVDLRRRVDKYMAEKGITEYTSEVGRKALWQLKLPSSIIEQRVRVYEMTREMFISDGDHKKECNTTNGAQGKGGEQDA